MFNQLSIGIVMDVAAGAFNGAKGFVEAAHETYVSAYEIAANVGSSVWSMISAPFSAGASLLGRGVSYTATTVSDKVLSAYNHVRGRPVSPIPKTYLERSKELIAAIKAKLIPLGKDCSIVFDSALIFSGLPSEQQLIRLQEQLQEIEAETGMSTPTKIIRSLEKAKSACEALLPMVLELGEICNEELTTEDIKALATEVLENKIVKLAFDATMENVGECIGGELVQEQSLLIPDSINPAVIVGDLLRTTVGRSVGGVLGTAASAYGLNYLLKKIPLGSLENKRTYVTFLAMATLLGLSFYELNPIVNFAQDVLGEQLYNFGFYSTALLFNYMGMAAMGTTETLPDYVRNMTPSMIALKGTELALNTIGSTGTEVFLLSMLVSHVAYNRNLYHSIYQKKVFNDFVDIDKITSESNSCQVRLIGGLFKEITKERALNVAGEAVEPIVKFTSSILGKVVSFQTVDQITTSLEKVLPGEALPSPSSEISTLLSFFASPEASGIFDEFKRSILNLYVPLAKCKAFLPNLNHGVKLANRRIAKEVVNRLFENASLEGLFDVEMFSGLQNRLEDAIPSIHQKLIISEISQFFNFMNTQKMQVSMKRLINELREIIKETDIEDTKATPHSSVRLEEIKREFIADVLRDYFSETAAQLVSGRFIIEIDEVFNLDGGISHLLNSLFSKMYPVFEKLQESDEACLHDTLDLIAKSFILKMSLRLMHLEVEAPSLHQTLENEDILKFIHSFLQFSVGFNKAFVGDQRLPFDFPDTRIVSPFDLALENLIHSQTP